MGNAGAHGGRPPRGGKRRSSTVPKSRSRSMKAVAAGEPHILSLRETLSASRSLEEFDRDYEVGEEIGRGVTGTVRVARVRDAATLLDPSIPSTFAVKSVNLSRFDAQQLLELRNEIEQLRLLDHPNIVRLYASFESPREVKLLMEHCSGGDLATHRFEREQDVAVCIRAITHAVAHAHFLGIIHRDLKLENIMFTSRDPSSPVKVIDFAMSAGRSKTKLFLDETTGDVQRLAETNCGTVSTMAPEALEAGTEYNSKVDVWSIGVMTYSLLVGEPPFQGISPSIVMRKIRDGSVDWFHPAWKSCSQASMVFTKRCLTVNAAERWTAAEALSSEWMKSYGRADTKMLARVSKEVLESLTKYAKTTSEMKRAAMVCISHQFAGATALVDMRNFFVAADNDRSGTLTVEELTLALLKYEAISDTRESREFVSSLFAVVDQDKSQHVRYLEFLAGVLESRFKLTQRMMDLAFAHFDVDNSGYITFENLQSRIGKSHTPDMIRSAIKEVTPDGVDRISRKDFERCMLQSNEQ